MSNPIKTETPTGELKTTFFTRGWEKHPEKRGKKEGDTKVEKGRQASFHMERLHKKEREEFLQKKRAGGHVREKENAAEITCWTVERIFKKKKPCARWGVGEGEWVEGRNMAGTGGDLAKAKGKKEFRMRVPGRGGRLFCEFRGEEACAESGKNG